MRLSGVILNFFIYFFYDKILQAQKAQKDAYNQTKIKKTSKESHLFVYLRLMLFMLIKTSKKEKVARQYLR